MDKNSIGAVARKAGIQPSALRYYEKIGLLDAPERINGQRHYQEESVKRLEIIQIAKGIGFTLKEIDTLLNGISENTPPNIKWKALASKKIPEIDIQIAKAEGMKKLLEEGINCDCLDLEECIVFFNDISKNSE